MGAGGVFLLALSICWVYNSDMPRTARIVAAKEAHHIYQRSAGKRVLFSSDKDRLKYLDTLRAACDKFCVEILAFSLLKNRIHLILRPKTSRGLAQVMGRTHLSYSRYMNTRRPSDSSIWQGRYQSCPVDKRRLLTVAQFVECQPVYDKLVAVAGKYRWSSASAHISGKDDLELLSLKPWPEKKLQSGWRQMLKKSMDDATKKEIQVSTQTGRPWGGDAFIAGLEKKFRRRLKALPRGRPKLDD
jgi:putative transposase